MMRILVVRMSALGDVVHALPAVASLKRAFPDARIDWLVQEPFQALVDLVPVVDSTVAWPRRGPGRLQKILRVLYQLRRERYDIAVDLQGLVKSAAAARLSGAGRVVGFDRGQLREPGAGILYTEYGPARDVSHVIEKNLLLSAHLGGGATNWEFPIAVRPSETVAETRRKLDLESDARFVMLNPGAAWDSKCWEPDRYGALASRLRDACGVKSVVTWGSGGEARAIAAVEVSGGAAQLAPPTGIVDLVAHARAAAVVVGGDTGPVHLAAAVGTPVVGIYGPSDPMRNGPWDPDDEVISAFEGCRCHRVGGGVVVRKCDQVPNCLSEISVDSVFGAVQRRLERARRGGLGA